MRWLIAVVGLLAVGVAPAGADYARPAQHGGLHDIVLIYRGGTPVTAREMLPLVAHVDRAGRPRHWFFDGFLFLTQQPGWERPKDRQQMAGWLDALFGQGGLLAELQQAVQSTEERIGPPPSPRQVMISIPYVTSGATAARLSDVEWFIDEVVRRWQAGSWRHMALWGTYWYWEDVGLVDRPVVSGACAATHRHGLKILWIPWFRASGWDQWREIGFDLAIMQPNYAFLPLDGGRHLPDESRLVETARLARGAGLGVEMETRYALTTSPGDRANFRLYLNHAIEDGYVDAVRAHFHSMDQYQRLAASKVPEARRLYDDVFALCAGRLRPRPLSRLHRVPVRCVRARGAGAEFVRLTDLPGPGRTPVILEPGGYLEMAIDPPRSFGEVRLQLARPGASGLRALSVYGRGPDEPRWSLLTSLAEAPPSDGGWLMASWRPQRLAGLRVVPEPFPGRHLAIAAIASYPTEPTASSPDNLALGRSYTVRPERSTLYPDSGGELTDGLVSEQGFMDGRTVGWIGTGKVVVDVTLPDLVPVDSVRCHVQGGGYAAVHFPRAMSVAVSADGKRWRLLTDEAPRAEPAPVAPGAPREVALQWLRQDAQPGCGKARYVRVTLAPTGWLMVSEVEVLSGGRNVALRQPYRFRPLPGGGGNYTDDGLKLTDGTAAPSWEQTVGWDRADAEVDVDLGGPCRVREVRAYVLGGGAGAVFLPESVEVSVSPDGQTWTPAVPARLDRPEEKDQTIGVWAVARVRSRSARMVRLRLKAGRGWVMLGEVEVRGTAE